MSERTFKSILVPVDFSETSVGALRAASSLVRNCGPADITAMYAQWFEAPPYFTSGRVEELRREFSDSLDAAEVSLSGLVQSALGEGAGAVRVRAVEALPADGIRQVAELENTDLIVMGTHGRTGLNRWMLGSVAERMLRESVAPVLTVRSELREPVQRVLCPVHDSDSSKRALTIAAGLSACFNATLTVLHVHEPAGLKPISNLCGWVPQEQRARCEIRELVRSGDASNEIIQLAAEEPYDLIVMGAERRRFFDGMVLGATTLRVVRHAPCPVLTTGA